RSPSLPSPKVVCSMGGLFPASEARVHLALGDHRLNTTVTYNKDSLSATAWVEGTAENEGDHLLVCAIMLGNQSQESWRNLTVYSFPAPNLTLSEQEVSEGTQVEVACEASVGLRVRLSDAPAEPWAPSVQFLLNATAEDNGRHFSCSAALEVAGHLLYKNQTKELRVLYGPRLDESDCLGNWTWPEETNQKLSCQAWGNPVPQLTCLRETDGALLPTGDLRPVKKQYEGTYICKAESPRGAVTRKVFLTVLSESGKNVLIIVLLTAGAILGAVVVATYLYNRQRKIKIYKLLKAQEAAAMKLNTQATPP
uniref:Intercellular adhesion molecule 1 n=1 Tax=Marmota marmota marmota TaxID=9994 RepID=A0A8C6EWH1_MARMA